MSSDGNSASVSDCGVCCANRGASHIDNKKIDNEGIFISDLYPQISQIGKPGGHFASVAASNPFLSSRAKRGAVEGPRELTETYRHGIESLASPPPAAALQLDPARNDFYDMRSTVALA